MNGPAGLRYESYAPGEWLMRIGPEGGPRILFVPPLLEEMNRTRALIAAMMRRLADRGFDCLLPDLPGTGESERGLETIIWDDWRNAVKDMSRHDGVVASLRGGCLLDDAAPACGYWRFAPVAGASLVRDLDRTALAGGAAAGGYPVPDALLDALRLAQPAPVAPLRVARLATDAADADATLEGPTLWRRSEPGTSAELVAVAADDLAAWVRQCAGS